MGDGHVRGATTRRTPGAQGARRATRRRVISVEWGWDYKDGRIPPKGRGRAGCRSPRRSGRYWWPSCSVRAGARSDELIFGPSGRAPFSPTTLTAHARRLGTRPGLRRITLHECRHTCASLIAAGVNTKALSTYMGHASIGITFDRYGHLMPGNEEEAAGLIGRLPDRGAQPGLAPRLNSAWLLMYPDARDALKTISGRVAAVERLLSFADDVLADWERPARRRETGSLRRKQRALLRRYEPVSSSAPSLRSRRPCLPGRLFEGMAVMLGSGTPRTGC